MPPEKDNKDLNTFRIDIDPVFKSTNNTSKNTIDQANPATAYNVLNNQKYTPEIKLVSATANLVTDKKPAPKSIVRTYKDDLESAIKDNHLSSINIAIAENQKMHSQIKEDQKESADSGSPKSKKIIFFSLILVVVGVIGISVFYFINRQSSSPTVQVQTLPSLITAEYKDELNVNSILKDRFVSALSSKLNDIQIPANSLYETYITISTSTEKRLITSSQFISLMNLRIPDMMRRTLLPDFMVGMYSFDKNLPFVILKTSSFQNTYSGMLSWETDLQKDFQILFRLPGYENGGGILDLLTPTTTKKFQDGVIINKDVRILYGDDNNIILLYGIIDQQTIIITVSDNAFKEIVNRLNKEKTLQR